MTLRGNKLVRWDDGRALGSRIARRLLAGFDAEPVAQELSRLVKEGRATRRRRGIDPSSRSVCTWSNVLRSLPPLQRAAPNGGANGTQRSASSCVVGTLFPGGPLLAQRFVLHGSREWNRFQYHNIWCSMRLLT
jgi:hypothetical protein